MQYFNNIRTLDQLKSAYKRLARQYHPDLGGNVEIMKVINAEYDNYLKIGFANESFNIEIEKALRDIIQKIITLKDIEIEICGCWIWVGGDTRSVKDKLKEIGFFWARKKLKWFWRSKENKSKNRKPMTMDRIRYMYGSHRIESEKLEKIS